MSRRLHEHLARLRARVEAMESPMPIPWAAIELVASSEDCRTSAYLCPAGVPTIGWGSTHGVTLGMRWTVDQADAALLRELRLRAEAVAGKLERRATPEQLGALTSLHYNIGTAGFGKSTVLRQHNAGRFTAAARAFALWNKARDPGTGQLVELPGLTARRAAEAALYLRQPVDTGRAPLPQAIEPESKLTASPIAQGGAVTVATGAVSGVAAIADQVDAASTTMASIKALAAHVAEFIGLPPGVLLAGVLIGAGWMVMKWRAQQRREGWA